ncbi:MAG: N-formylglutamate amidohydrolase [Marinilabiliaceae bacterium]|nr:N-formylglutamate amidohydrolase [Marinilabiliaceae bacterium]
MKTVIITCEHGGNEIPDELSSIFNDAHQILLTHRGYDIGALELYNCLSLIADYSFFVNKSRLIVDLNRSLHRKTLFSDWTKLLDDNKKTDILKKYYYPFRNKVGDVIEKMVIEKKVVIHLSIHSFTPVLNGVVRNADIGILYHPQRLLEKEIAVAWKKEINTLIPQFKVRFNYPYLGKPDGHVAAYRKIYDNNKYAGLEFELNQKYAYNDKIYEIIAKSLEITLKHFVL